MESKIVFVRFRMMVGKFPVADVVYKSKRCTTYEAEEIPKTVKNFIESSTKKVEQVDPVWGKETIYTT